MSEQELNLEPNLEKVEDFLERVRKSHQALGIPVDYAKRCPLPLYPEPPDLVDVGLDFYQRPQRLLPSASTAWIAMQQAATDQGISLFLISCFRSLQYQHNLISAKLEKGQEIDQILSINAAPGYSEHHSGRAVDVGTIGCDALVEEFENTEAFQWLVANSRGFGFSMSYPRNNHFGIDYEPWHWCFGERD